jgi:hypothetical protein
MVVAGHGLGATDDARAVAQLAAMGNGPANNGQCTVPGTLPLIRKWTTQIVHNNAKWLTLLAHHTRLMTYAPATSDIWELKGWLYATDPTNNHRVLGATGFAAGPAGTNQYGAEKRMVLTGYRPLVYNGPAQPGYGWPTDSAGHIRPRSFGGSRDPLNFVPQSSSGQKMVGTGEGLAQQLIVGGKCNALPANSVRYGVYFTYTAPADRRPARARTVVDLLNPCTTNGAHRGSFGPPQPLLPATPLFNHDWPTF